jgi:hypothetical protein
VLRASRAQTQQAHREDDRDKRDPNVSEQEEGTTRAELRILPMFAITTFDAAWSGQLWQLDMLVKPGQSDFVHSSFEQLDSFPTNVLSINMEGNDQIYICNSLKSKALDQC